jgi:hypothetical protein
MLRNFIACSGVRMAACVTNDENDNQERQRKSKLAHIEVA